MQGAKTYRLVSNVSAKAAGAAIYIRPNLGRIRRSMQPVALIMAMGRAMVKDEQTKG
jgi:hypothetical protein